MAVDDKLSVSNISGELVFTLQPNQGLGVLADSASIGVTAISTPEPTTLALMGWGWRDWVSHDVEGCVRDEGNSC